MLKKFEKWCKKNKDYAPLVLRIVLGLIFIAHGYTKLMDMNATIGFFTTIGIPLAMYTAWLVALVEFFGGLALVLGLWTRVAALLVSVILVIAILKVKLSSGLLGGYAYDLMLLASAVSTMLTGAGGWSLDAKKK